uniref:Alpha-S2-casein n=1 Tax=Castor canadensis TaxID=51338 RepID=A0A8C0WVF0_CASCN
MKFFIVTFSLLAIAFANHMEQQSSSEESVNISQEKFKQEKNVVILPSEETTKCPEMESAEVPTEESASFSQEQYKQKKDMVEHTRQKTEMTEEEKNLIKYLNIVKQVTWPQYLQVDHQYQKTMNPWNHVVINPYEVIFAQV